MGAVEIVEAYLHREFPGASLFDFRDGDRSGHTFSVHEGAAHRRLTLSREFLEVVSPERLAMLLAEWRIAVALRDLPAGHRVIMTTSGIRTEAG